MLRNYWLLSEFLINFNDPASTFFFNLIIFHHNVTFYLIIILVSVYWVLIQIIKDQKYEIFSKFTIKDKFKFILIYLYKFNIDLNLNFTLWRSRLYFPIEIRKNEKYILSSYIYLSTLIINIYITFYYLYKGHNSRCNFDNLYLSTLDNRKDIKSYSFLLNNIELIHEYFIPKFKNINIFGQWIDFEEIVFIDLFRVYNLSRFDLSNDIEFNGKEAIKSFFYNKYIYSGKNYFLKVGTPVHHKNFFEKRLSQTFVTSLNTLGIYEILYFSMYNNNLFSSKSLNYINELKISLFILKTSKEWLPSIFWDQRIFWQEILDSLNYKHSLSFEYAWTFWPSFIIYKMLGSSYALLYSLSDITDLFAHIKVIGHQWYWSYEINFGITPSSFFSQIEFDSNMLIIDDLDIGLKRLLEVDNRLILPCFRNLHFLITSSDVLHSFAVPELGLKVDAVPGRINTNVLYIEHQGLFYGQCSELCGVAHGFMPIVIEANIL